MRSAGDTAHRIPAHIAGEKERTMAKVGIVMGSDSDMPVMAKAADILEKLGIDYEMTIISAHRRPDVFLSMRRAQRRRALR